MTAQSFPGGLVPMLSWFGSGTTSATALILDAANEKAGLVFQPEKSGDIVGYRFRTGTVTTGTTADCRVETVNTDMIPSGTLWDTDTNGALVVDAADDQSWLEVTFTNPATVSKGDLVALVFSIGSPGNLQFLGMGSALVYADTDAMPKGWQYTSAWTANSSWPTFLLVYDDGDVLSATRHRCGVGTSNTVTTATTPDEMGNIFRVPVPCSLSGVVFYFSRAASGAGDIILYDSSNNVLATVNFDFIDSTAAVKELFFDSSISLAKDTDYRVVFKPSNTNSVFVQTFDIGGSDVILPFFGLNFRKTSRTDAGAWTDDDTLFTDLHLIFDKFDDGVGAGSGGLITHPGMGGGFNA